MASDYKRGSPSSDFLNLGSMGVGSTFGGGSQPGSDYGFATPQSLSIDTMMQSGPMNGNGDIGGAASLASSYRSAPAAMPGSMHGFGSPFDTAILPPGSVQHHHRGSMSSLQGGSSPLLGHHHHRLSISSNGLYSKLDRHNSIADSDATSPGGQHRHGSIDENSFGDTSNDALNNQGQGDDETGKGSDGLANAPPPWSELKTKAGKERKRLPLACIACRRKKIRCSGEKPACKHCLRSRIPCVYKVTTRKAAPRTDYMAMLDKRLKRMEERVIKIIPEEEQGIVNSTGRANVKPPLPPPPPKPANGSSKKRAAEHAFYDELDDWANAAPTTSMHKDQAQRDTEAECMKPQDAEEHNLLLEGADKLPSKELQEHLAEVFFDYVYGQSYHLLHKPSFMRKLDQGSVPPVLTLAVCAISARFSNHPQVRTEPAFLRGENWAAPAREIALRRYDTPNLTILIVYLILGLHEFGTCQGGRSWMFGGMAQRMAYALQLHKDLDYDPKSRGQDGKNPEGEGLSFTDREIRRRTMWSCFLMDRFSSSGTDRPIFVAEQDIRAQLPIKESYYQMEITGPTEDLEGSVPNPVEPDSGQMSNAKDNLGVAAYMIRLVAIWGRLIQYLNLGGKERDKYPMWAEESMFMSIRRAAQQWREELPKSLHYTPENLQSYCTEKMANQFLFLHIVYNQIILFMNRFALPAPGLRPSPPKDMPQEFLTTASRAAFEAANQASALIHEAMDHLVVAPFAGYTAFFSSTVHIYGAFSKNAQLEASSKQNLAWNVKYLTKVKKYWGMFHFITENLRDLYRRHADAARTGANQGRAEIDNKDGEIFQYGDWFDRYPHGVSGTDYEEPSAEIKKEPGSDAVLGQKSDLQTVEEFFSKLSPPSRATQQQRNQYTSQRKMAKKRHSSKAENKTAASANGPRQFQQQDSLTLQQMQQYIERHNSLSNDMLPAQNMQDISSMQQHSIAFPPGFQPPPNPLLMDGPDPQQFMSQLDRQMVLNSYAGIDTHSIGAGQNLHLSSDTNNHALDPSTSSFDLLNLDAFSTHAITSSAKDGNNGFWGDPSTAWFLPFNMDPPAIGDDNNLFSTNNFEWSTFGGFGDIGGGLPPTGLTSRPEIEIDTGQEAGLGSGQGTGLDGLDGMQ